MEERRRKKTRIRATEKNIEKERKHKKWKEKREKMKNKEKGNRKT